MKPIPTILITAAVVAASVYVLAAIASNSNSPTYSFPGDPVERLARGEYLVHRVGVCIDCHSPRDERGEFVATKHLTGSPIPFAPTVSMPWMPAAPRIAGLAAGFTETDMVHFLMTGERPGGRPAPLPPMPLYRLNRADAEAVTAYLQSLPVDGR